MDEETFRALYPPPRYTFGVDPASHEGELTAFCAVERLDDGRVLVVDMRVVDTGVLNG